MYHAEIFRRIWSCAAKSVGGCTYWDDYRNVAKGRFVPSAPTLLRDTRPRAIDCNVAECTPRHMSSRVAITNAACSGPTV